MIPRCGYSNTAAPRGRSFLKPIRLANATRDRLAPLALALSSTLLAAVPASAQSYTSTLLVDNICCGVGHYDPHLAWGWGIAFSPTGPAWVVDNFPGASSLYDGNGNPQPLLVRMEILFMFTGSAPTGVVFNGTGEFVVPNGAGGSGPASFLFATQEGTITGWTPTSSPDPQNTIAFVAVDNSQGGGATESRYTGLIIAATDAGTRLYATDFQNRRIDAFNGTFAPVATTFTDPNLPAGYAPHNIIINNGTVYIAYAIPDAIAFDPVKGPGFGIVDSYSSEGQFRARLATGGVLNAPWGMAIAPANFGPFSGALLVANNGDGLVNAFNPTTGTFLGSIRDASGAPIAIEGIRGIQFGNGFLNQPTNTLFYASTPTFGLQGNYGRIELTNTCYANCDASTAPPVLNANDFQCFLNRFAAGDPGANCDGSTHFPTLNANDFQCFLNAFAAGCS